MSATRVLLLTIVGLAALTAAHGVAQVPKEKEKPKTDTPPDVRTRRR